MQYDHLRYNAVCPFTIPILNTEYFVNGVGFTHRGPMFQCTLINGPLCIGPSVLDGPFTGALSPLYSTLKLSAFQYIRAGLSLHCRRASSPDRGVWTGALLDPCAAGEFSRCRQCVLPVQPGCVLSVQPVSSRGALGAFSRCRRQNSHIAGHLLLCDDSY